MVISSSSWLISKEPEIKKEKKCVRLTILNVLNFVFSDIGRVVNRFIPGWKWILSLLSAGRWLLCFWCLPVANIVIMSVFSPRAWKWKVLETGFKAWERSSSRDSKGKGDKWQQVWNQRRKWHLEGKRSWGKYKWQGKPEKPESCIQWRLRGNSPFLSRHLHDWLLLFRKISYSGSFL